METCKGITDEAKVEVLYVLFSRILPYAPSRHGVLILLLMMDLQWAFLSMIPVVN